jgi:osmoprotectant transport system ATP-binding protein
MAQTSNWLDQRARRSPGVLNAVPMMQLRNRKALRSPTRHDAGEAGAPERKSTAPSDLVDLPRPAGEEPQLPHSALEIRFDHVTKVYGTRSGAATALRDLSLVVPAGEICCLVGPSGGGKTTAMRLVNRLIEASEGDILVGGRSIYTIDPVKLRRDIGYVIQDVGLFPHLTIAANIAVPLRLHRWPKARAGARVAELLELVGLDGAVAGRYPAMLSGGQQQRVGLARALAVDPPIMLMDEPFGALDPITRTRLQDEFLRLQRRLRKTVIFVTHDIDEALKMGDKVAVLREGGVLAQYASPAELLAAPADEFVASFVGADRGLKRLALQTVGELCGASPAGPPDPALPTVDANASLRTALSVLIERHASALAVCAGGRVIGAVTLEELMRALPRAQLPADLGRRERTGG